jgi:hypothetical protein
MRIAGVLLAAALVAACSFQRAQMAQDARAQMVGFTKEQILACMGPAANKATEGATEVWSYPPAMGRSTPLTAAASHPRRGGFAPSM